MVRVAFESGADHTEQPMRWGSDDTICEHAREKHKSKRTRNHGSAMRNCLRHLLGLGDWGWEETELTRSSRNASAMGLTKIKLRVRYDAGYIRLIDKSHSVLCDPLAASI